MIYKKMVKQIRYDLATTFDLVLDYDTSDDSDDSEISDVLDSSYTEINDDDSIAISKLQNKIVHYVVLYLVYLRWNNCQM